MRFSIGFLAVAVVLVGATACSPSTSEQAFKAARPLWGKIGVSVESRPALKGLLTAEARAADDEVRRLEALLREENTSAFCDGVDLIDQAYDTGASMQGSWDSYAMGLLQPALEDDFSDEQIEEMAEGIGDALLWLENAGPQAANYSSAACVIAENL